MAAITVRAKAHTAAPIWATSYLQYYLVSFASLFFIHHNNCFFSGLCIWILTDVIFLGYRIIFK